MAAQKPTANEATILGAKFVRSGGIQVWDRYGTDQAQD